MWGCGLCPHPKYTGPPLAVDLFSLDSCTYYIQRFVAYLWLDGVNLEAQIFIWKNEHAGSDLIKLRQTLSPYSAYKKVVGKLIITAHHGV